MTKQVDYSNPETLVNALKGQEALIITLSGMAPQDTETKLVHAAGEAGVPWILPSEWAPDTANEALVKDVFIFRPKGELLVLWSSPFVTLSLTICFCLQSPSERLLKILARALTSLSLRASGTSILLPCPHLSGSTLLNEPRLYLMKVRQRSLYQRGHRCDSKNFTRLLDESTYSC